MSKNILVRIPTAELETVEAILARYPGLSPAEIFRALLLTAKPITIRNAISKHAVMKSNGFNAGDESEK